MVRYAKSATVGVSRDKLRRRREREEEAGNNETARSPTRQSLGPDDASIKIYHPAARLKDGPRDGWVYYVKDLEQQQRAAAATGGAFPYRPTGSHTVLPGTGGVKGVIWRYNP